LDNNLLPVYELLKNTKPVSHSVLTGFFLNGLVTIEWKGSLIWKGIRIMCIGEFIRKK